MNIGVGRREVLRREVVLGGLALAAMPSLAKAATAEAAAGRLPPSKHYQDARAAVAQGREIAVGRVALDLPRLAESGHSVTLKVRVESPMTEADYVKTVYLLAEQNPVALVARFFLSPRSGRADVSTSIRLATTQTIHAIAETNSGALFEAQAESVVLLAACLDGG